MQCLLVVTVNSVATSFIGDIIEDNNYVSLCCILLVLILYEILSQIILWWGDHGFTLNYFNQRKTYTRGLAYAAKCSPKYNNDSKQINNNTSQGDPNNEYFLKYRPQTKQD